MFSVHKLTSTTFLVIIFGLYLQQFKYIFYTANAQLYRQQNMQQQQQQSPYGPMDGKRGQRDFCISPEGFPMKVDMKVIPSNSVRSYSNVISQKNFDANNVQVTLCCPGYKIENVRNRLVCVPVCENCRNGQCVGPNECACYDGFVANDNGDCVFTCPLGCLNGRCFLDGSCQCDPGYKLDISRRFCRPICSKGCGTNELFNCTSPEVCGCINGYILSDDGCRKVCTPDCGIGGECRDGRCICNSGFTLKDGVCQSECYQDCVNGVCLGPNRCICNPGFFYNPKTTSCKQYPQFDFSQMKLNLPKF